MLSLKGVSGGTRSVLLSAESARSTGDGPTEGGRDSSVRGGEASSVPRDGWLLCPVWEWTPSEEEKDKEESEGCNSHTSSLVLAHGHHQ